METKRKTKTSSAVKNRYNKKHYKQIALSIPLELAEQFNAKTKQLGDTKSSVLRKAIEAYLE